MIRPGFLSSTERPELGACVGSQREDHGVARRANAILLPDDGKSCQGIAEFPYLDDDTIRDWHKIWRESGWEALAVDGWKGGQSGTTPDQDAALCTWPEGRFCRSTVEIRSHIASGFGLDYPHSGCIRLLARLGFEYCKPRPLPKVASAERQASLIALYEPLMTGLGADEAVHFADAVHPEQQTKPAFGRVRKGSNPAVNTTAGRGRVNIHGAPNLETFDAPLVEPTTVDGTSAARLLSRTEARNPDKRIIHVTWHVIRDNAACHKGPDVRAFLARPDCRIHLVQLPPYCPHLNPIERLWAPMHRHVTHNRHDPTQNSSRMRSSRSFAKPSQMSGKPSEARYQTTFASQHIRNFGPWGNSGIAITRPNQVWCADITYIRLERGFLYLVAIMYWYSRRVLAWRLSNTLETDFCVAALKEALTKYGPPEILNTDQGSQFTSGDWIDTLRRPG